MSRWPLYVRQAKQLLKTADEGFDERRYGFNGIIDALRYGQREGLFRLDRDRQGVIRVYPGDKYARRRSPRASHVAGGGQHGRGAPETPTACRSTTTCSMRSSTATSCRPARPPSACAGHGGPSSPAGRGRVEAEPPVEVRRRPRQTSTPIAVVEHVPVHEEPPRTDVARVATLDVELRSRRTAASDNAGESRASTSRQPAKPRARKRTAAPRKRAVKKAVKKTAK